IGIRRERDPLRLAARGADNALVHLRVRRARAWVFERDRRALRMARIGDVDGVQRAPVGALEADLLAVGRPPEPAAPAELLLRDELGDAVLDSFGVDRQPPGQSVRDEPEIAVANERDGPAIGRQMRIVNGALRIDDTPGAGRAID